MSSSLTHRGNSYTPAEEHKQEETNVVSSHPSLAHHEHNTFSSHTIRNHSTRTIQRVRLSTSNIPSTPSLCHYIIFLSLFTITDGAIRMIVLLHAYTNNFSALEVAIMFSLYELAGVFTNLAAGFMGAKWGIKCTLISGLTLQLLAYGYVMYHYMYADCV